MQKQKIILVICGLVILAVIGGTGFYYKMQADRSDAVIKTLGSKLISSIMAFGQVKNITGSNLTLSYSGNTLVVKMQDNAKIMTIVNGAQKQGTIADLKTGDFVNVTLTIATDNTIQGKQILVLPAFNPTPAPAAE